MYQELWTQGGKTIIREIEGEEFPKYKTPLHAVNVRVPKLTYEQAKQLIESYFTNPTTK